MAKKEDTLVKTHKNGYSLHLHDHAFDAGLAVMWNESDDQWPGTFTGGVPMTEKRVAEWMDRVTAIVKYIVLAPDGAVVGYGDLWDSLKRPRSAYVAVLNVHPAHQGKSLGRLMLTEMVDWAAINGYDRFTIGTWSANLKAMPLYKKVGFFWQPGTNVLMENYIPAVRQLPLARDFFTHNDWYQTYDRELAQVEDDMRHPRTGDMKVYVLRWQSGDDFIEAVFDQNAQALTGLATPRFAAFARVTQSEPAQGLTYPIQWELENNQVSPISVSLMAAGDPGISLDYRKTFTLEAGEKRTLATDFSPQTDAPKYEVDDLDMPTPQLRTVLVIDGEVLEFGTGVRYRPAVEVSVGPRFATLLPGTPQTLHLQLRSRVDREIKGTVTIQPQPGLKADWLSHEFKAAANGYAGLPITLTAESPGEVPINVGVSFDNGADRVSTVPKRIPLLALRPGGLAVGTGEDEMVLENEFFRLTCKTKGGEARIWNKADQRDVIDILEELGEPFVPWDLNTKTYTLALERGDDCIKVQMAVESGRFPGISLVREITMSASPLLQIRQRVTNNSLAAQEFQVRPTFRSRQQGLHDIIVPLKTRTIVENTGEFPLTGDDVPEDPSELAEPWIAFTGNGQVSGVIWLQELDKLMVEWGQVYLFGSRLTLNPQKSLLTEPTYLYVGPGDWQLVHRTWQRLTGEPINQVSLAPQPKAQRYFDYELTPSPLVTLSGALKTSLCVSNTRKFKLTGEVTVNPPEGWKVDQGGHILPELTVEKALEETLVFTTTHQQTGAYKGKLCLSTQLFDEAHPFTILRLGDEATPVFVRTYEKEGQAVWQIANGRCAWELAPTYHGGVIGWREVEHDTNHLFTSFPEDGELSWMKPWFGGLRPTLNNPQQDEGWPGKLHTETFSAEAVKAMDERGLPWEGVTCTCTLTQEEFRGLQVEIAYLTLGGSNVLKVVYRLVNQTDVYRMVEPSLMAFVQVDGTYKNGVLHSTRIQRKRTQQMAWVNVGDWAAVENPATGRAVAVVNASGWRKVQIIDWGEDGGHFNCYEIVHVPPEGVYEITAYLVLAESLDEARRYGVLSGL